MIKFFGKTIKIAILFVLLGGLLSLNLASSARADSGAATYSYLIGTGFLCDLDPSACPAVAEAANGDVIEMTGEGMLSLHPKSVSGGGTFKHMDDEGNVVAEGTWEATQLLSFDGYGCDGEGFPEDFCGGRAVIRVDLLVEGEKVAEGTLQVDCVIGDKIPAGATEGVRLAVTGGPNFNKEVSGFTLYILE